MAASNSHQTSQQIKVEEKFLNSVSPRDLRVEISEGLLYAHSKLNSNSKKTLESLSFLYALIEILEEKGLINIEELDQRKADVAERLLAQFKETGMGAMFQDPEYDKYNFNKGAEIDCSKRLYLCKAACCRLPFALSKQDIREGIVRWDLGQPYLIDQGQDGYCNHLDRCSAGCTIYENRPVPCRGFDCREDQRVWLDFDDMQINPQINRPDWPRCLTEEAGQKGQQ